MLCGLAYVENIDTFAKMFSIDFSQISLINIKKFPAVPRWPIFYFNFLSYKRINFVKYFLSVFWNGCMIFVLNCINVITLIDFWFKLNSHSQEKPHIAMIQHHVKILFYLIWYYLDNYFCIHFHKRYWPIVFCHCLHLVW